MLTLILGRAGSGKTSRVMGEIRDRALEGETGLVLLVPEQYSHDAERRLCAVVGDSLSLHGEVLSFTRLASRVFSETGGGAEPVLDPGGRLLTMYCAMTSVEHLLRVYGGESRRTEFLEKMLGTLDEFKTAGITAEALAGASFHAPAGLGDKLYDLSLIFDAYDAALAGAAVDPGDMLTRAADALSSAGLMHGRRVFVDGFTDFTAQEQRILTGLLKNGAHLTVCLTCDGLAWNSELFAAPRRAARLLTASAEEYGVPVEISEMTERTGGIAPVLSSLEKNLFSGGLEPFDGDPSPVELWRAGTRSEEYELAAARVIELLKAGYRYRDIAVVSCEWDSAGALMESVFEKYGLPIYLNRKTDILQKPPVALICSALEIVTAGWEYENVFAYLRTGLTGIAAEDVDRLENYVITWSIRGAQWTRESAWDMPPGGYGVRSDSDEETLSFLDNCRRRVIRPLLRLQGALRAAETGGGHVRALYAFLEEIGFCRRLEERSEAFRQSGDVQLADEYAQLWSILRGAMEQYDAIMGSRLLPAREFTRLWRLLVSRYDIASIPVALDRVGLGDIARHRRRDIRCLIVTGAFDGALPRTSAPRGLLSESECRELREMGMELHSGGEEELYREIYDVYASLTLPSDRLIMTYPADAASDRPSYILTRIRVLTGVPLSDADVRACRMTAPIPRLELAVSGDRAAAGSFLSDPEAFARLTRLKSAAEGERRALTRETAKRLYGRRMRLSASRVERFAACPFAYFVQYGLKAKPRRRAGFDSPVYGTFMHYILENVTRETAEDGGYAHVDEERCRKLTRSYVRRYAEEELGGLADKSSRFIYLFRRLSAEAEDIVLDMLRELQNSDFAPLDFELSFASRGDMPPVTLTEGEEELSIEGLVDRVDGWVHNGRLYLKIVDYKTGKKSFSLSDIWYGMGMQMLIYLFALANGGESRYKMEIVPAGVLYVPAREAYLNQPRDIPDEKLAEARARELRRSGLLLSDDEVLEAMGRGEGKRLLPVKFSKDGAASGDALASLERMGVLARHIDATLRRIGREMHSGRIAADPYFKSQIDNACRWCEYHAACHFSEEGGDLRRYLPTIKTEEVWHKMEEE